MPPNVTRRIGLCILLICQVTGCAGAFKRQAAMTPGPSGAIAAAPLGSERIAVLAGTDQAKGVFVIDLNSSRITQSFGVTREATSISTEGPDGPLLIGIGGRTLDGHPAGSVERWSLQGVKLQVVPMPAQVLGLSQVSAGELFVLIGDDRTRAAVPIAVPGLGVGKAIPLDAQTDDLALCQLGSDGLLVTSAAGAISARSMDTGQVVRSRVAGQSPTCIPGQARIYAISKTFLTRSVIVLGLPDMSEVATAPASNDARALYPDGGHGLLALNATEQVSNIQLLPIDELGPGPTAAPQ